jgi:hypothetical protein
MATNGNNFVSGLLPLNQLERETKTNKAVLPSRKTEARRRNKGVNNNKTRYDFTV